MDRSVADSLLSFSYFRIVSCVYRLEGLNAQLTCICEELEEPKAPS